MDVPRRRKVPKYDEYGNYLGDVREGDEPVAAAGGGAAHAPPAPAPRQEAACACAAPGPSTQVAGAARAASAREPMPPRRSRVPASAGTGGAGGAGGRPAPGRARASGPLLYCGMDTSLLSTPSRCTYTTHSELDLVLHRADRHLVYPPGGLDALRRMDPMRIAEERERQARARRGKEQGRAADGPADSTILGLNIRLDTPELIAEWIQQRRKRFPTARVVQEKRDKEAARAKRVRAAVPGQPPAAEEAREAARSAASRDDEGDSHGESSSSDSSDSDTASSSNSDMDLDADAVTSKAPVTEGEGEGEGPTRVPTRVPPPPAPAPAPARRVPRVVSHPFQVPDLLRQLLDREILQHVDALAQLIDFVLDNDMLAHVELRPGDAHAQQARRERVVVLREGEGEGEGEGGGEGEGEGDERAPRRALPPHASPTLRPLASLVWPDEPDPLVYLDPLRATDPKPLRHSELLALATDTQLRHILQPRSALHPHGETDAALQRALQTWAALPTPRHREAALQLMLGVGAQSPMHAHEAYAPPSVRVRAAAAAAAPASAPAGGRRIGETELFRLGLRVGPNEVRLVQHMAERVSHVTAKLEYDAALHGA